MKLKNERYEVCFVEKGGEILSFTDMQSGCLLYTSSTDVR